VSFIECDMLYDVIHVVNNWVCDTSWPKLTFVIWFNAILYVFGQLS